VAPRNQRQQAIAEIVGDLLGLERVSAADDLFDLGIDSLSVVELLTTIRDRVGVDLRPADLVQAPTVAELAERIDNAANVRAGTIVPLSLEGPGAPLFVVSPGPDRLMFPVRRLARLLNRPTYSFAPHGFGPRARPDVTVERAAARYLQALRTIQPSGPRLIAGKSFGAIVAYEMACQLAASGEPPALLVLLDPASGVAPVRRIVEEAMNADFIGSRGAEANRGVRLWRQIRRVSARRLSALADRVTWWRPLGPATFFYTSRRMKHRYRPSPYNGRTLLFRTEDWERFDFLDLRHLLTGEVAV
jgi:acyl carrier protein